MTDLSADLDVDGTLAVVSLIGDLDMASAPDAVLPRLGRNAPDAVPVH